MLAYIPRTATDALQKIARYYPIVSLTGPRQAGKTTLLRETRYDQHIYIYHQTKKLINFY